MLSMVSHTQPSAATLAEDDHDYEDVEEDEDDELTALQLLDSSISNASCSEDTATVIPVKSFRGASPKQEEEEEEAELLAKEIEVVAELVRQPKFEIKEDRSRHGDADVSMEGYQGAEEEVISDYTEDPMASFQDEQVVYILDEAGTKVEDGGGQQFSELPHGSFVQLVKSPLDQKPKLLKVPRSIKGVPSQPGGEHVCSKCNKSFSTRTNLQRHINSHGG